MATIKMSMSRNTTFEKPGSAHSSNLRCVFCTQPVGWSVRCRRRWPAPDALWVCATSRACNVDSGSSCVRPPYAWASEEVDAADSATCAPGGAGRSSSKSRKGHVPPSFLIARTRHSAPGTYDSLETRDTNVAPGGQADALAGRARSGSRRFCTGTAAHAATSIVIGLPLACDAAAVAEL